jgi:hypothetical protein
MFTIRVVARRRLRCCLIAAIFSLAVAHTRNVTAKTPALTAAERWVLQKVVAGEDADLKNQFLTPSARVITSSFVRQLLTNDIPGVKVPSYGVQIFNATVTGDLDLTNQEIPFHLRMQNCDFEGYVSFLSAQFKGSLSFSWSRFHGPADFRYTTIVGRFDVENVNFLEGEFEKTDESQEDAGKVQFNYLRVEGPVFLTSATFERPVIFYAAGTAGNFEANDVHFKQSANFELMEVRGHAFFNRAIFEGGARFFRVKVTQNFEAEGARFNNELKEADFEGLNAYAALFRRDQNKGATIFNGPVRFYGVNTSTNLVLDDAHFNKEVELQNMSIKGDIFLRWAVFNSGADFWGTTVGQSFDASETQFKNAKSWIYLADLKADVLDLRGTSFTSRIDLSGLTFREVRSAGLQNLSDLIGRAAYDAGTYAALEDYYRRQGNISAANDVYITRRRRARASLSYGAWLIDLMYDGFVGYGRRPGQVIIPIVVVLSIGWWMFRNKRLMQAQDEKNQCRPYSPIMYSLDLFLPIVDLRAASIWEPKESRRLAQVYLMFHVIAGWVLITIFVTAITGIVK